MVGGRPRCRDYKVGPTTEDGCPRCLAFGHLGIHSPSPIPSFLSQPQNRMSIRQTSPSPSKNPAPNLQSISPLRRTMESVSESRKRPMPCQSDHEPLIRGRVPPTPPLGRDLRFSTKSLQIISANFATGAAAAYGSSLYTPTCSLPPSRICARNMPGVLKLHAICPSGVIAITPPSPCSASSSL